MKRKITFPDWTSPAAVTITRGGTKDKPRAVWGTYTEEPAEWLSLRVTLEIAGGSVLFETFDSREEEEAARLEANRRAAWRNALAFLALIVVLIKRGETAVLNRILFGLVTKAEKEFGDGTGKLKLAAVSDWIYQRIPAVLKLLFSEKDIEKLIESALEEAKKAWGTNGNLAAYIEPEYVIRMTPAEADEIAAKLNAEPGTIVTLEEK